MDFDAADESIRIAMDSIEGARTSAAVLATTAVVDFAWLLLVDLLFGAARDLGERSSLSRLILGECFLFVSALLSLPSPLLVYE